MTTNQQLLQYTLPAAGDLSAAQHLFVKVDTAGRVALASGGGDCAIGVLQNDPAAIDLAATVGVMGITKVIVGSAGLTAGDKVQADTAGKAVTSASAKHDLAIALETGVSGDVVKVMLISKHLRA